MKKSDLPSVGSIVFFTTVILWCSLFYGQKIPSDWFAASTINDGHPIMGSIYFLAWTTLVIAALFSIAQILMAYSEWRNKE